MRKPKREPVVTLSVLSSAVDLMAKALNRSRSLPVTLTPIQVTMVLSELGKLHRMPQERRSAAGRY